MGGLLRSKTRSLGNIWYASCSCQLAVLQRVESSYKENTVLNGDILSAETEKLGK